jgi:hypothetical protein
MSTLILTHEVANLDFDRKNKQSVMQTHKRRKIIVDQELVITSKIVVLDAKKTGLAGVS